MAYFFRNIENSNMLNSAEDSGKPETAPLRGDESSPSVSLQELGATVAATQNREIFSISTPIHIPVCILCTKSLPFVFCSYIYLMSL